MKSNAPASSLQVSPIGELVDAPALAPTLSTILPDAVLDVPMGIDAGDSIKTKVRRLLIDSVRVGADLARQRVVVAVTPTSEIPTVIDLWLSDSPTTWELHVHLILESAVLDLPRQRWIATYCVEEV